MTEVQALKIIENNIKIQDKSFIYELHEKDHFDQNLFWKLYDALITLVTRDLKSTTLDRQFSRNIAKILGYTLKSVSCHFSPFDVTKIKGVHEKDLHLYVERIEVAVDGYLAGYLVKDDLFELKRPSSRDP